MSKQNLFTTEEVVDITTIYVHTPGLSRTQRAELASALHTGNTHSIKSWAAQFGRLEKQDNQRPRATEFIISRLLREVAQALDPLRFA